MFTHLDQHPAFPKWIAGTLLHSLPGKGDCWTLDGPPRCYSQLLP